MQPERVSPQPSSELMSSGGPGVRGERRMHDMIAIGARSARGRTSGGEPHFVCRGVETSAWLVSMCA